MTMGKAPRPTSFWSSSGGAALGVFLAGAALVFIVEHRVHALQWLPFALLLACPLLHFVMHKGHGHHGSGRDREDHR